MYVSARYNHGLDLYAIVWNALYTSLKPEACVLEVLRHTSSKNLGRLHRYALSSLDVSLSRVLDFRDPDALGLAMDNLIGRDFSKTQQLAEAAIASGAEAVLAVGATGLATVLSSS
jgi:hypothetical protein